MRRLLNSSAMSKGIQSNGEMCPLLGNSSIYTVDEAIYTEGLSMYTDFVS